MDRIISVAHHRSNHSVICDIFAYIMLFSMGACMITDNILFSYSVVLIALIATFKYNESLFPILFFLFLLPTMFDAGLPLGIDKIVLAIAFIGRMLQPNRVKGGARYGIKCFPFFSWFIFACLYSGLVTTYDDPWAVTGILVSDIVVFLMYFNSAMPQFQLQDTIDRHAKCAFLMIIFLLAKSILNPVSVDDRLTLEDDLNINQFAMGISQTTSVLFTYMLINKERLGVRILYLGAFTIGVFLLLSTGSRSATIALLGSSFVLYYANAKLNKKSSSHAFLYLLIIFAVLAIIFNNVVGRNSYIGERYTVESLVESDGASRGISLMIELEHTIPEHPVFGVGPSSHSEMDAVSKYGGFYSSHNIVFSTITQIGFLGFIPFVLLCFFVIRKLFKMLKISPLYSIPLGLVIACILNGVGEVVYNSRMMWFALSFSLYMINSGPVEGFYKANNGKNRNKTRNFIIRSLSTTKH